MGYAIGDLVWLRRDSELAALRARVGTNLGKVGDSWSDQDGEHISVVYEDEQVLAMDVAPTEFLCDPASCKCAVLIWTAIAGAVSM